MRDLTQEAKVSHGARNMSTGLPRNTATALGHALEKGSGALFLNLDKNLIRFLLAATVLLSLTACGSSASSTDKQGAQAVSAKAPVEAAPTTVSAIAAPSKELLTPADVERVTGLTGIKAVAPDPSKGADGDLNFATSDGKMVVMIEELNGSFYYVLKNQQDYFHADVAGIGDEAFDGPSDNSNSFKASNGKTEPYVLVFRKYATVIRLSTFLGPDAKAYLNQDQLRELAKIIVSRL